MNQLISPLGEHGSTIIEDTEAHAGTWFAIQMIEDTLFAALAAEGMEVHDSIAGLTFKTGMIIFGTFTAITLTSGAVIAYKAGV